MKCKCGGPMYAESHQCIKCQREAEAKRQRDVLRLLLDDEPHKSIADRLQISIHTVSYHVSRIYRKAHCVGLAGLTRWAIRNGIINA
jgi:DNA-binding CsgD family transcriptional regulator